MTEIWSSRAEAFRDSPTHREGPDLDLVVAWCEPGPGVTTLDVATGGGHVARRLREAGCQVVSVDPAPGMGADVIARAEDLPFADRSFDAVACRIAAHHFADVAAAVREMARVSRERVVIQDNLFVSESSEEADRLRDPTHVRNYSLDEWRRFFHDAGLEIDRVDSYRKLMPLEDWLARVETPKEEASRVRELLSDRIEDGQLAIESVLLRGRKGR
jgi:ubiquinone/menaquinone biosynthesis C-methylase UbiE